MDEVAAWYEELDEADSDAVYRVVGLLEERGVTLPFRYSSQIKDSSIAMRELRTQSRGEPIRILYAFDPARQAVLLLGGHKGGDERWYVTNVPIAEERYRAYAKRAEEDATGRSRR